MPSLDATAPDSNDRRDRMTDASIDSRAPLDRSLRPRHVAMIALGGVIGAGLFVGSSAAILHP